MFYLRYIAAELRRRRGRTVLTALGLGVGVGLVITVSALSNGLDEAQSEVLEPLTGVGTDMTVNRPIEIDQEGDVAGGMPQISAQERRRLEREGGGGGQLDFDELGDAGEEFSTDTFMTTDLSFPAKQVKEIKGLDGVTDASPALTLNMIHIEGTIPSASEESEPGALGGAPGGAAPGGGGGVGFEPTSVTGIDPSETDLGLVKSEQVTDGHFLKPGEKNGAMLTTGYADENNLKVGDKVKVGERKLEVVGLVKAPLGAESSDIYTQLSTLQKVSDNEGRVNTLEVRASDVDSVDAVAKRIENAFKNSEVTTAKDLSDRVSGSLVSAQNLSDKLGLALAIVALAAAFGIASLLTLASVNKRIRELGTLKALGWRQWRVVRQVSGESVAQGLLGGAAGAVIGIGGAAVIGALGITLEASAGGETASTGFGPGAVGEQVTAGSSTVTLGAPVDGGLVLLAIALALIGGLIAGSVGGLRAARLRPAEALRSVE